MRCCALLALASTIIATGPAFAARIIVTVSGLSSTTVSVYVRLYATPSKFLNGKQVRYDEKGGSEHLPISVTFDNLPPGTYAIGAFHETATTIWIRTLSAYQPKATHCRTACARS